MRSAGLALAALLLGVVQDAPADPFAGERWLPPGPLFYLQAPGTSKDYPTSALKRFLDHEEIRAFLEPVEAWVESRKTKPATPDAPPLDEMARAVTGLSIDEILGVFEGPLSAALYDLPLGPERHLDLAFTLGDAGGTLPRAASRLREALKRQNPRLSEGEFKHQGVVIHEIGDDELRIYSAVVQKTLIVATRQSRIEQIVAAAAAPGASLKDDAGYTAARARVAPDDRHLAFAWLDARAVLKRFRREIGDEALQALEAFGVADVTSLAAAADFDGGFIRERYALITARQDRGLVKALAGGTPKDPQAAVVPAGSLAYVHAGIDLAALYDAVLDSAKAVPELEEEMVRGLKQAEEELGIEIRKTLASVGTSWTAWSVLPEGGGFLPYDVTAVGLRDPAAFEAAVGKLAGLFERPVHEMRFRGRTIRYLTVPMEDASLDFMTDGLLRFAYPLAWTVEEGTLYFSTNPLALKRHILRAKEPAAPIAKDPRFAALAARVPADGWESWMYVDLGRLIAMLYSVVEPFLHFGREVARDPQTGELIVDLARLPLPETLRDLIGPTLTHKRTLPDAILIESWSNIGLSYTSVVSVAALTGAVVSATLASQIGGAAPGGIAGNELLAQVSLQFIRQAQETFRNSDSDRNGAADYWTRDVAGLYGLKDASGQEIFLVEPALAQADPAGAARYGLPSAPKDGYHFAALTTDPEGAAYGQDEDKDGQAFTNRKRFGLVAWPAVYGATGRHTFLLSEAGRLWKKDTEGQAPDRWPGKDPAEEGWEPAD